MQPKKKKKKARMQPIQNAKGFGVKGEPKNMVILKNMFNT